MPVPANLQIPIKCTMRVRAAILSLVVALSACSTASNSMLQTLRHAAFRGNNIDGVSLNPNFRYLRVTIAGRVVLLALGNVDITPLGPVEVWYSAEREVLRLQNGRLVGAVGVTAEWRNVVLPEIPAWSTLSGFDKAFGWTRIRDVMPGYRFGLRDAMSVRLIAQPGKTQLQGMDPKELTWFEERVDPGQFAGLFGGSNVAGSEALPPARYGVDLREGREIVVYGEQCLERDLCFSWQRWPAQGLTAAEQKR